MIEQVFRYTCDACGRTHEESHTVIISGRPVHPWPPPGWEFHGFALYCDRHEVVVTDKEEVLAGDDRQRPA